MTIIAHPTNENLRIRTEYDQGPSKPYNDGGFPIWRMEDTRWGGFRGEQETDITSYVSPSPLDHGITEMWRLTHDWPTVERYLRIFWGATFARAWHSGSYWYLTADPADWREEVGIDEAATAREEYSEHAFDEWQAWVEGNVHIAWPERRVFVRSQHQTWDLSADEVVDESEPHEDTDEHEQWVDTGEGPVGGYYGDVDQDMAATMAWQFGWETPDGHTFEMED